MKDTENRAWRGSKVMAIDAQGTASGLAILWQPEEVSLTNFWATRFSLFADFQICRTFVKGVLTNVYGLRIFSQKVVFLETLPWTTRLIRR